MKALNFLAEQHFIEEKVINVKSASYPLNASFEASGESYQEEEIEDVNFKEWYPLPLGNAAYRCSLPPEESYFLFQELKRARGLYTSVRTEIFWLGLIGFDSHVY